jgi:BirA family transcriptional regulator, biotin operon repressor / biotin---[acetyl-CoA-carboxylase] ligase
MPPTSRCAPDLARAPELIAARGGELGKPYFWLEETTSTNDEAKAGAKSGAPHGAVWVAESQSAGRGRQGRTWLAARGESLLVSVLLRIQCAPARLPPLALVAGLAVRDAVARAVGAAAVPVGVKWPNDVLIGAKKVAGVLVEAQLAGKNVESIVVGVGINVHARSFPEEIAARATSVALETTSVPDRGELLADLLYGLDRDLPIAAVRGLGTVHARLTEADVLRGSRVRGELGEGLAEGIDLEGRLCVRGDDGILRLWTAGEVTPMAPPKKKSVVDH